MDDTPLRDLIRALTDRTALSQEDIAREAGVSLATVNKMARSKPGQRFETEPDVRKAIARMLKEEGIAGWDTTLRVRSLENEVADLKQTLAAIVERLEGASR